MPEILTVIAIVGLFVSISLPAFAHFRRSTGLRAATQEIRAIFHFARSRAIARGANCAVKFSRSGSQWMYAIYDDCDGDGVRNDDIRSGTDTAFAAERVVLPQEHFADIGISRAVRDVDGRGVLSPESSPVRFNSSTLCSFSPDGSSTPGSIFLTDGEGGTVVVRVYGTTAKIRVLRYHPDRGTWETR
jgi:Tfp pilus assembly protein FimT